MDFGALIGQHDRVTLLNGDPTVHPRVCRNESVAAFILTAVSELTVINVIISVSAAIAAVSIIFVTTVITNVIMTISVIFITTGAAIISDIIVTIVPKIISNISPALTRVVINFPVLRDDFISSKPMKGVTLELIMCDEIMCYLWSGTLLRQRQIITESDGQLVQDPISLPPKGGTKDSEF